MKISPQNRATSKKQQSSRYSSASKILSFFIKYCLLPVTLAEDKIDFYLFSWKSLIHATVVSLGGFIYAFVVFVIITPMQYKNVFGDNAVGKSRNYLDFIYYNYN